MQFEAYSDPQGLQMKQKHTDLVHLDIFRVKIIMVHD